MTKPNHDEQTERVDKAADVAFEALCESHGEIVDERARDSIHWQRRRAAFTQGYAAGKREGSEERRRQDLAAVKDESELPGDMPDDIWALYQQADRTALAELLRMVVRGTKRIIADRIAGEE